MALCLKNILVINELSIEKHMKGKKNSEQKCRRGYMYDIFNVILDRYSVWHMTLDCTKHI